MIGKRLKCITYFILKTDSREINICTSNFLLIFLLSIVLRLTPKYLQTSITKSSCFYLKYFALAVRSTLGLVWSFLVVSTAFFLFITSGSFRLSYPGYFLIYRFHSENILSSCTNQLYNLKYFYML